MIQSQIYKKLSSHLKPNSSIILGISGGIDSIVLFNILNNLKLKLNINIYLAHINYSMHKNSTQSELLCRKIANKYKCKIFINKIKLNKNNFEHNARKFRYKYFNDLASKYSIDNIITAHHLNDQIETLYIKENNHSDWISKIGIRQKNDKLLRPMLNILKSDIINYAKSNNIKWVDDLSNNDMTFERNYVRNKVLPDFYKNNPNYIIDLLNKSEESKEKFKKFINNIPEYNDRYLLLKKKNYIKISNKIIELKKKGFLKIYYQTIIKKSFNYDLRTTKKNWNEIFSYINNSKSSSKIFIKKFVIIMNKNDHFIILEDFLKPKKIKLKETKNLWYDTVFMSNDNLKNSRNLLDEITIPREVFKKGLYVRNWKYGDKCYKNNSKQQIRIKKLFENIKISKFEKLIYPIFVNSKDTILYIPNIYNSFTEQSDNKKIYWMNQI